MAHPALPQFSVNPVTAQTFFREPMGPDWTDWYPLPPSDYHPLRPFSHNVGGFLLSCINPPYLFAPTVLLRWAQQLVACSSA